MLKPYPHSIEMEIAVEQVIHVPLEEYREGAEHYERLIESIQLAQRFRQPEVLAWNV